MEIIVLQILDLILSRGMGRFVILNYNLYIIQGLILLTIGINLYQEGKNRPPK